jgi:hypothetical protein
MLLWLFYSRVVLEQKYSMADLPFVEVWYER